MPARERGEILFRKCQPDMNPPPGGDEVPRRHQGISSIVPLAAKDECRSGLRKKLPDTTGDTLARNLHKPFRGRSPCKGGLLGGFHLRGGHDHEVRLMSGNDPGRIQNVEIRKSGKKH